MSATDHRMRAGAIGVLGGAFCGGLLAVLLPTMQVRAPLWYCVGLGTVAGCLFVLARDVAGEMEVGRPVQRRPQPAADPSAGSLTTLVRRLAASATEDRLYALHIRPLLLDLAAERLRLGSGRNRIVHDASEADDASLVRAALGEELWMTLMRSGPAAAPLTACDLERVVAGIERL